MSLSHTRRLLIYNTTISIVLSIPVMIVFDEMPGMSNIVITTEIWNALIISGLLGFLINIAIFMQVKYTTPLTNAISGTAKVRHDAFYVPIYLFYSFGQACIQTLLGWLFFRNEVSTLVRQAPYKHLVMYIFPRTLRASLRSSADPAGTRRSATRP